MTRHTRTTTGRAARDARREGAAARAGQRESRSAKEQLELIATRPGSSTRETARLEKSA